jgi:histone H3
MVRTKTTSKRINNNTKKEKYRIGPEAKKVIRNYIARPPMLRIPKLHIPMMPFKRLVTQIAITFNPEIGLQTSAVQALQEAAEGFLQGILEEANICALHAKRTDITPKDIRLVRRIKSI